MNEKQDYSQPVAYDAQGRPLYAHPPTIPSPQPAQLTADPGHSSHVTEAPASSAGHNFDPRTRVQYANEPGVHHVERPIEPQAVTLSEEVQRRSEDSKRKYPYLNLSEGEYVILDVRRHPIGLFIPVSVTVITLLVILGFAAFYPILIPPSNAGFALPSAGDMWLVAILLSLLVAIFGYFATWIYMQNKFFMTNESVIQEIQHSLFSKHEQTVSLGSIEDASFKHSNFIQTIFDYGTIRLSTEGEETTYRFHFVSNPKRQVAILNNAVEAFKNGRPVTDQS